MCLVGLLVLVVWRCVCRTVTAAAAEAPLSEAVKHVVAK